MSVSEGLQRDWRRRPDGKALPAMSRPAASTQVPLSPARERIRVRGRRSGRPFGAHAPAALVLILVLASCAWAQPQRPELAETPAGDLVADALKASPGAQVAFVQAGALKAVDLAPGPAGNITAPSLLAYPDDRVVVVEMKGDRVTAALERGLLALPHPQKGFLQVAGIAVAYDPKAPAGQRVKRVMIGEQALSPSQSVLVAMPLSLARGYLGFFRVFNGLPRQDTGQTMKDAVARYLATKPTLPKPGERLTPAG